MQNKTIPDTTNKQDKLFLYVKSNLDSFACSVFNANKGKDRMSAGYLNAICNIYADKIIKDIDTIKRKTND